MTTADRSPSFAILFALQPLQLLFGVMPLLEPGFAIPFWPVAMVVTGLLVSSLRRIATRRGHAAAWGLLGVLNVIGVAVVLLLPPRVEQPQPSDVVVIM